MKHFSKDIASVSLLANVIVSAWLIILIHQKTNLFKVEKNKIASILNFNDRLLDVKEAIPFFGDWVWEGKNRKFKHELELADKAYSEAIQLVIWLVVINLCFIVFIIFVYYKQNRWFALTFSWIGVALVMFSAGIATPMLEMEAYKTDLSIKLELNSQELLLDMKKKLDNIPFMDAITEEYFPSLSKQLPDEPFLWEKVYPDKMYFFYENKGIFDVITTLWRTNNIPIAFIVGIFSLLIPLIKIFVSFYLLYTSKRNLPRVRKTLLYLTKFSMMDVMVVSLFLTYFTFNDLSSGVETSSNALIGIYLFAAYVVLAIFGGYTLEKLLDSRWDPT